MWYHQMERIIPNFWRTEMSEALTDEDLAWSWILHQQEDYPSVKAFLEKFGQEKGTQLINSMCEKGDIVIDNDSTIIITKPSEKMLKLMGKMIRIA